MKEYIKPIINLTLISSLIYIIWRVMISIPLDRGWKSLIFSIIIVSLEILDFFEFCIFYVNSLKGTKRHIIDKKIKEYPDVDVVVVTLNEDIKLLERTLKACNAISYPNKEKLHIYVSDDGKREEVKILAESLNINYITRENNINAKAGNYNNLLNTIKSPYILTLDADMAPKEGILLDLIPHIARDKDVGFVQTPQGFENGDIYQYRYGIDGYVPNDQSFFYHTLQPLKNNINAVVYCGTNAIIRREALDKIGGFAEGVLTEDIATGMLIQNAGYKGIYIDKVEAVGYQENDLKSFIKQRTRWARGCIQTSKKVNLLKMKGLNLKQKLEYFSCFSYWLFGIKRLIYLIAPLLYNAFDVILINTSMIIFTIMWLPQYVLKRFVLDKVLNNERSSTWNKIYEIILTPILSVQVFLELIGIRKKKFEVSSKKNKGNKISKEQILMTLGHIFFIIINLIALGMSVLKMNNTFSDIFSLIWSMSNLMYLFMAILFDLSNKKNEAKDCSEIFKYNKWTIIKMLWKGDKNN